MLTPNSVRYLMVPLLFWIVVLVFHGAWMHEPRIQASMRYPVSWSTEMVWEYTGKRPIPGEELILFGRQGNQYPQIAITLVAYLVPRDSEGPHGEPWMMRRIPITDFFSHGWMSIPAWPHDHRLYVGYRHDDGVLQFWEPGPWPSADLDTRPWVRQGDANHLQQSGREEMGMVDIRLMPEGTASARSGEDFPWEIRALPFPPIGAMFLGAWLVVMVAGMPRHKITRPAWILWNILHLTLLLAALSSIAPSQYFWTSWFHDRMGGGFFWWSLPILQLLLLPPVLNRIAGCVSQSRRVFRPYSSAIVAPLCIVAISLLLVLAAISFPSRGIYGDDIGALYSQWAFGERHNPLSSALFYVYLSIHEPFAGLVLGERPNHLVRDVVSWFVTLWFPLYLFACWGISRLLGRTTPERLLTWSVLVLNKLLLLHFGYLEVYGPALAVMATAVWLLLRSWLGSPSLVIPTVASFFSYLFHLGTGAMLPLVALLWWRRALQRKFAAAWLLPRLAVTLFLAGVILAGTLWCYFVFKYEGDWSRHTEVLGHHGLAWLKGPVHLEGEQPFLSLWGEMHHLHVYTALSWEHVSQWGGGILFATGPVLPMSVALVVLYGHRIWRRLLAWAAVLTSATITGASFLIFNYYPYPRDWDLFAIPGFLQLICLLVLILRECPLSARARTVLLLTLAIYFAWDGGIWLVYNLTWGPPAFERPLGGF